jgi:hypothetical protein
MVFFIDDSRHPRCDRGALAFTVPGRRVVRVCAGVINAQQPEYVVASIIHEILHSLGWARTSIVQGDHGTRARSVRPEIDAWAPRLSGLERPGAEQEIDDVALVWL